LFRFWQLGHGVRGGIARGLGAGERFEGSAGEVLASFENKAFKLSDAVGVGGFLFEGFKDGLHVLIKVGHGLSLQVPFCGCTRARREFKVESSKWKNKDNVKISKLEHWLFTFHPSTFH
jgi:hypothetical protein